MKDNFIYVPFHALKMCKWPVQVMHEKCTNRMFKHGPSSLSYTKPHHDQAKWSFYIAQKKRSKTNFSLQNTILAVETAKIVGLIKNEN